MPPSTTRRGLLAATAAVGIGGAALTPVSTYLEQFAPLSGQAWESARRSVPETVDSPYGHATVTYDEYHTPHVEADTEEAAYFAVGYVQAADRLFQMDLTRRLMSGTLSAVVGDLATEADTFHAKMDFLGGAQASAEALSGTDAVRMLQVFADGVNAYADTGPLALEFALLGYEPDAWTIVDSLLVGAQISWGLTGNFDVLRRAVLRQELDDETYDELYPAQLDHGAPILREGKTGGEIRGVGSTGEDARVGDAVDTDFLDWLGSFEPPPFLGSNSWVVSGEHTESGSPIVCNDMHLTLMAPPVWYEQRVSAGDVNVRGVSFPGIPFVIAGENDHGAWGFTNTGADVIDFYTYETNDDLTRYRYKGEWRAFETETRTIEVAGGENEAVEIKRTVHGAFLDRDVAGETRHVGVAWTGMTGTRESASIYELSHSQNREDALVAIESFDVPTQNFVYADRTGNTLYAVTGQIPVRTVDGDVVRGEQVFDGSAGEAEWEGFVPFGQSTWEGFIPFEEKPGVIDPAYIGTANQRLVDDPTYPIGHRYASGFRGLRIYERLDDAVAQDTPIDTDFMQAVQTDTLDVRARMLVPAILDAREKMSQTAAAWADQLLGWDYRMDRESAGALVFRWFYEYFREEAWASDFEALGLDESYWPQEWVLVTLPEDHEFFEGDRERVIADAMERAVARIESEGWETYGDYNVTAIDHQFGGQVPALNYPRYPTDGSVFTVMNFRRDDGVGASQRSIYPMDGESMSVLPGGNDGSYFSDHYDDQLRMWADGEYRSVPLAIEGDPDITFTEVDQ